MIIITIIIIIIIEICIIIVLIINVIVIVIVIVELRYQSDREGINFCSLTLSHIVRRTSFSSVEGQLRNRSGLLCLWVMWVLQGLERCHIGLFGEYSKALASGL